MKSFFVSVNSVVLKAYKRFPIKKRQKSFINSLELSSFLGRILQVNYFSQFDQKFQMEKSQSPKCFILKNGVSIPATLHQNQFIEINQEEKRNSNFSKVILQLSKNMTFSVAKTEHIEGKSYKFTLQLKLKDKQPYLIVVNGKEDLEFFMKNFCRMGYCTKLHQIIDSFQKIDEGNFAQVYKVITKYQTVMALKAFSKYNLKNQKNRLSFHNQISIMRQLNIKYIAQIKCIFQTQKNIFIQMEYFPYSLKKYLKRNISVKTQKIILKQILFALIQMKTKNIVHRDLKPQNIMIRTNDQHGIQCVIIDFGLATKTDADNYIFYRCGTPGFLAPEVAKMSTKNQKLTTSCDMFSLGCIFYQMLTKKYIFAAKNYEQVMQKNKNVDFSKKQFDKLSIHQKDLLEKMLYKDPSQRITPQEAVNHPYFCCEIDDDDQIPVEQCDLTRKLKKIMVASVRSKRVSMDFMMSSFHQNFQILSTQNYFLTDGAKFEALKLKDSCLSFGGLFKESSINLSNKDFKASKQRQYKEKRLNKRASRFSELKKFL